MLQQTPVARVEPVWREWMARWPTPADLAADAPGEAVRAWGRLGYPRRALRLHAAAVAMAERHGGAVPATEAELLALPGVGAYTAAAVATFAFGERHDRRRHQRAPGPGPRRGRSRSMPRRRRRGPSVDRRGRPACPTDPADGRVWNVAVMELGALVCTARVAAVRGLSRRATCAPGSAPADRHTTGPARTGQAWDGTDRQVRGALLGGAARERRTGAARRRWRRCPTTRSSASAASTRSSPTGWSSRWPATGSGCPRPARRAEMSVPPSDQHGRTAASRPRTAASVDRATRPRDRAAEPPQRRRPSTGRRAAHALRVGATAPVGSSAAARWRAPGWPGAAARRARDGPGPTRTPPAPARAAWPGSSSCTSSTSWATPP